MNLTIVQEENRRLQNSSREVSITLDDPAEDHHNAMETVPARGLRRERNEGDDELEIMAPPAKKPATIVDLTDD